MLGEEWIREAFPDRTLRRHVEALCRWDRVSGQRGELEAAAYIASVLKDHDVPHEVYPCDAYVSYPIEASLFLGPHEKSIRVITHSFGATTPPEGITAPLVDVGDGRPTEIARVDLRGKIAATDGMALPWVTLAIQEAGAVGHVNLCHNRHPHEMCMSPAWGTPEPGQLPLLPRIPIVSTDEAGVATIHEAMSDRAEVRATLRTRVWTGWAPLKLPVARIRGAGSSSRFLLVGSHYDSWYKGATDTATTDALLLEMAAAVHAHRDGLRRAVRIAWWPGHSQGRYAGSAWYADRFERELQRDAIAYLNLDGGGALHASRFVLAHTAELAAFNADIVREITGWPTEEAADEELLGVRGRPARNADQSFLCLGVPSLAAYSEMPKDHPDRGRYAAASGGGWWWHTPEDTPDKVDYGVLQLEAILFTTQVVRLASARVLPLDVRGIPADLLTTLSAYQGAAGPGMDFSPALDRARELAKVCETFEARRRAVETRDEEEEAEAVNDAALTVTRILNPILYSTRGPYHPDPAVPTGLLPGLSAALRLPERAEGERGFALAEIRRELNRVVDGLEDAARFLETYLAGTAAGSAH